MHQCLDVVCNAKTKGIDAIASLGSSLTWDSSLAEVYALERSLINNPIAKRVVYDAFWSTLDSTGRTPQDDVDYWASKHEDKSGSIMHSRHFLGRAHYADIHLNRFNSPPLRYIDQDSHFRLLCMYASSLLDLGIKLRIIIHGLPFSGHGWPSGDPCYFDRNLPDLNDRLKQAISDELINALRESHPIASGELHDCVRVIVMPPTDNSASFKAFLRQHIARLRAIIKETQRPAVGVFIFSCVTGLPNNLIEHLYPSSPVYRIMPCVNNRVRNLPSNTTMALSPVPLLSISNKPLGVWGCKYINIKHHRPASTYAEALKRWIDFGKLHTKHPFELIIVGTKDCLSFMSHDHSYEITASGLMAFSGLRVVVIGGLSDIHHSFIKNLDSLFDSRVLCLPFVDGIQNLLQSVQIEDSGVRRCICVPPNTSGSGEVVVLAAEIGIASVVRKPNDIAQVIGDQFLEEDIGGYYKRITHMLTASCDEYERQVNHVLTSIESTNRINMDALRGYLGIRSQSLGSGR